MAIGLANPKFWGTPPPGGGGFNIRKVFDTALRAARKASEIRQAHLEPVSIRMRNRKVSPPPGFASWVAYNAYVNPAQARYFDYHWSPDHKGHIDFRGVMQRGWRIALGRDPRYQVRALDDKRHEVIDRATFERVQVIDRLTFEDRLLKVAAIFAVSYGFGTAGAAAVFNIPASAVGSSSVAAATVNTALTTAVAYSAAAVPGAIVAGSKTGRSWGFWDYLEVGAASWGASIGYGIRFAEEANRLLAHRFEEVHRVARERAARQTGAKVISKAERKALEQGIREQIYRGQTRSWGFRGR